MAEHGMLFSTDEVIEKVKVRKSNADTIRLPLSVGGEVRALVFRDAEEHVRPPERGEYIEVTEGEHVFFVKLCRKTQMCGVDDCVNTATQKFDGNWLCESHLNSYTSRHV